MNIKYLLSDLDGVIRKYPPERDLAIEKKFQVLRGTILSNAFEKNILTQAVCGCITDEAWRHQIAKNISKVSDELTAQSIVNEWSDFPGIVDFDI